MTRSIIPGLIASVALVAPVVAEQNPIPGAHDPRVRYVPYDAINVVKVTASDLRSTLLQFGDDETVDVVAIGDQTAWSWSKVRNLLFVKPSTAPARPTNMQVVTLRKEGQQRIYQFDLDAGPASSPVFGINFAYPGDIAEARRKAAADKAAQLEAEKARQRLDVECFYGRRNWAYVAKGSTATQPAEVSDNGKTTAFRFAGNTKQPAIYQMTPDGKEQIAVTSRCGNDIVIAHGTAAGWRLRMGEEVVDIWNVGFDAVGQNPFTGTTSPEVVRTIRSPKS